MAKNSNWSYEELTLALYWYCTKIPFTKVKYTKPEVIELAKLVGRTPSAAAFKLVNFARLDPTLQNRGVKGMSRGAKAEEPVWNEYYGNWEQLAFEAEKIIAERKGLSLENASEIDTSNLSKAGRERLAQVKLRINQKFFRDTVLVSYNNTCCVSGIKLPGLLIASHIKPLAKDLSVAANPKNGLCLNALHDKAFDKGFMTITTDYTIKYSAAFIKKLKQPELGNFFLPYKDKEIILPFRFLPDKQFLEYHNEEVFNKRTTF